MTIKSCFTFFINMKKTIIAIVFFLMFFNTGNSMAQVNLLPDSSFEMYYNCFNVIDHVFWTPYSLIYWKCPNVSSPDSYNSCEGNIFWGMPQNTFGYQQAKTGNGYVNLLVYSLLYNEYREYVETKLNEPLLKNRKYCVSFYISLDDSSNYASDDIGAYFSDTLIYENNNSALPFIPQVANAEGNFIVDKVNWVLVSGSYTAHGGEQYITLGNFKDDAHTDTISVAGGATTYAKEAIYYLDDVSVYLCDTIPTDTTITDDIYIPNIFSPNGDLNNDVLYVRSHNIKTMDFNIYNRWGEKVFETKDINKGWDGTYKNAKCNEGVFVYYLNATLKDNKPIVKKGNVTLIR